MKKLLIIPLIALAAGCGSQSGATSTVTETAPAKTVTLPSAPVVDDAQVQACQHALDVVAGSAQSLAKATGIYINQIKAAYLAGVTGGSIDVILSKMDKGTSIVHAATQRVEATQGESDRCHG